MALYKRLLNSGFKLRDCEKHFHDHDETWVVLRGKANAYWIDHAGLRENFELEPGDVWMIPAGYEHGSAGPNSDDFEINVFNGSQPRGCHKPGHYYVEKEGYIPGLTLTKTPTDRYRQRSRLPMKMKGIMFVERGRAVLQDEDAPTCLPHTLLCRTIYSGLTNGTERNVLMGGNYGGAWPARCGYQNVAEVLEAGAPGFAAGDLIFSGDFCQHREFIVAPVRPDSLVIKLPPGIKPLEAALFGVASVAMHDVRRAGIKLGDKVLVVGAGPVGQFTAQAARAAGALVTVCDLDEERLAVARRLGAHAVLAPDKDWANIYAHGPFDAAIEDSGAPLIDYVIRAVKPRGTVVLIAGRERVDYGFNAGQCAEISVMHAGHFTADDLRQVCRLTAEGAILIEPIIREVVDANDAIRIYDRLRDNPSGLFGTVFDWMKLRTQAPAET